MGKWLSELDNRCIIQAINKLKVQSALARAVLGAFSVMAQRQHLNNADTNEDND
jgi:methylthioribose-1-phosphate isomerase